MENYSKTLTAFMKLPPNIQKILRRKSSRDPSSQFTTKLHVLLTYVMNNPSTEEELGVGWITNEKFRMNKKILVEVMGIKINTLNVNLKDLKFIQLQRDKDGWTQWTKEGFTKKSPSLMPTVINENPNPPSSQNLAYHFTIGLPFAVNDDFIRNFFVSSQSLWEEIVGYQCESFNATEFIHRAANMLKQNMQPIDNAESVLQALISPSRNDQSIIEKSDFIKFLAMFGPRRTVMIKIASLLEYSNSTGSWLFFSNDYPQNGFYGSFSDTMPNCLVLHMKNGSEYRIYNVPTVEAQQGNYIYDQQGSSYESWGDFFKRHPEVIEQEPNTYMY
ncbi:39 kDa initiator binding protein [Histomonas meleagridis]|uniref:39 kDa initiator binding protein n=1 Tax=Histomonas meleagridis TaxID=135588 RepID=UPI003559CB37|nr:39 kDa initiator binding protein [Histomonas meleagridis]KAH0799975.1 39 kDa initiator binding protein [Histomonas meleagridis]